MLAPGSALILIPTEEANNLNDTRTRKGASAALLAKASAACAISLAATTADAAIFSLEGPLLSVTPTEFATDGVTPIAAMVNCNGVQIRISNATTYITSPTARLTVAQLADTTRFANEGFNPVVANTQRLGFIGGGCIADGDDTTGVNETDTLFVEVSENVLIGNVTNSPVFTANAATPLQIKGVDLVPINDPRMPSAQLRSGLWDANQTVHVNNAVERARNTFGFGVNLDTIGYLPGTTTPDNIAAEGYLGQNGKFYFFAVEVNSGTVLTTTPRASVARATVTDTTTAGKDKVDIRGGCILRGTNASERINIWGLTPAGAWQLYSNTAATCTFDPAGGTTPRMGLWRFSASNLTFQGAAAPTKIRVQMVGTTLYDFIVARDAPLLAPNAVN